MELDRSSWDVPGIFRLIASTGIDDLEMLRAGTGAPAPASESDTDTDTDAGAGANLAADFGVAKVELVADTNLTSGDCIVDSDAATVDGRLGTRVEELRRVLEIAIHQESSEPRAS